MNIIYLCILGCVGVLVRYALSHALNFSWFPMGTLIANITGSFAIGWLYHMQWQANYIVSQSFHMALMVGGMGALTTYSSFSLETVRLIQAESYWLAGLNIALNTVLCLIFCVLGIKLASSKILI